MGLKNLDETCSGKLHNLEAAIRRLQQGGYLHLAQGYNGGLGSLQDQLDELRTLYQHLEEQNRALQASWQAAEDELAGYRGQLRLLSEGIQGFAIFHLDSAGRVTSWNPGAQELHGYLAEEIIGQSSARFYTDEDIQRELPQSLLQNAASVGCAADEGWRLRRGGQRFWACEMITHLSGPTGQTQGFVMVVHDLTERKHAEDAQKFQGEIIRNLAEGVVVTRESDGAIVYTNSTFDAMFGYGPTELIGQNGAQLIAADEKSPEDISDAITSALGKEGSWSGEVRNLKKDGTRFWSFVSVSAFNHHEYGNVRVAVHTDITQRKAAEEALRESETKFRSLVESANSAIVITDQEGRIVTWNRGARNTFGYTEQEARGRPFTLLLPQRYHAGYHSRLQNTAEAWKNQVQGKSLEFQALRKDGSEFPVELSLFSWRTGGFRFFGCIIRDVTERQQTEDALGFQGQIMRNLAEGVVVFRDRDGAIVYANSRFEQMFGYQPAEFIGLHISALHASNEKHRQSTFRENLAALRRDGSWSGEVRNVRKDGTAFWCYASVSALDHHEYGKLWVSVRTDITQRKAAEEALRESETKFRSLVESANAAIVIADREGHIVAWNPGAQEIFGYTQEEALGQPSAMLIPERHGAAQQRALERAAVEGEGAGSGKVLEFQAVRKDGSEFPVELSLFSWTTGDQRFFGGIFHDVTERREAEEYRIKLRELALQEEEWRRFETLIDTSPVGVLVVDARTQQYVLVNPEAQRLRGSSYQPGKRFDECGQDIIFRRPDGQDWDQSDRPLRRALLYGETVRAEESIVEFADGHTVPTLINASPVYSKDGHIVSAICVIQDLSPRRDLEAMRNEFLGMVAHELRTPLSTIKGAAASGLRSRPGGRSTEGQELFQIIGAQVDLVTDLVNDLLDMSRIEAGAFSVSVEPTDIAELLGEAASSFARVYPGHQVELKLPQDLPAVQADRWRIMQVLTNLLNNAARFSPPNCPITLELEHQGNFVTVHVRDQGPGIPQEKLPYLFKKFTKLGENHFNRDSGLGLSICQGIVEAHGEHIWADSGTDGQGTTISFTLPVVREPVLASPPASNPDGNPPPEGAGAPAEGLMILTVDDDHNALKFLRRLLEGAGYHTMQAANPEQALKAVELKSPDLVLLDLVLPDIHGLDLMRKIREIHQVPVIFLTARATRDDMVNALKMGADDYVTKPFSESELLARIEAVLRRNSVGQSVEKTPPYRYSGLVVDFEQRQVTLDDQEVSLSATEYKLLSELAKHSGRVMTHEQILQLVWGREYSGETELLRSTVRRLRLKLGENAHNPRFVLTVSQVGYRMADPSALQPISD